MRVLTPILAAWLASAPLAHAVATTTEEASSPPLSLGQAVLLARAHNPMVLESRARSESARQASTEARLTRLPAIALRETGVRTDSPADAFGLQLMQERFSFPAFVAGDPNRPEPLNNFTTQIEATMPLFTGGQLSQGIRQAGKMADAAAAMQEHTASAVDLSVAGAYLNALAADRFEELARQARESTLRHYQKAQDFYAAGMMVESDLLAAEVQLAKMEQNLIAARGGAGLARAALDRVMGIEQDRSFHLTDASIPSDSIALDLGDALAQAMRSRRDIVAVERRVQAAQAGIGRARGEYWPQIGATARYSWNDDRFAGNHGDSYMLAASAQWQIWNWGATRARVGRSHSEYRAALESQRSYGQQVEFEVRQAWQGVAQARAGLDVSQAAVRAAERALAILEDRYDQGLTRMTDLLDAETMAHEARVRETQMRYDLQSALRTFRFVIGLPPIPEVQQ
jgi:outer membrane protein